ncbi:MULTISPECIES: 2-dehydropantoate 2-reductase [unclassified Rhizobacter]|uniref:2-dehydropantoate 2-reductase n=1 Tax=unclassified Rhizobacter TaxID=2640088 RepID=UPI0006F88EA6|nr:MULTISPECIES: 2-dehydropantoate 2-reductase [unclassified Rhizobacter]KQU77959.1 2-dehydropantoate 2-reductase [Rhizobacter sp. Root29]KQW15706.1 2-dehydropantoate 2-reductase [Rhizobacter sp. Root1238]KRB24816.1 2-dehydropantoate 2-reductase [Rhizobacter sp. Root16D2]
MKFAIVGAGAIGGYLGARLALAGEEVTFIARNRNLAAINANGFRLIEEDGREQVARNLRAVQRMAEAGPQDVVLLTLKAHQVKDVLPELRELFGPHTLVVTMINGLPWWYFHKLAGPYEGRSLDSVDPGGVIGAHIEPERVIGGIVYPASELVEPGVVRVVEGNRFTLGELDGSRSERIEALAQAMMRAGFKSPVSKDIRGEIWVKLWGNLSFNPISALTHATLQDICRFPATRQLAARMMTEAQAIGEKLGVEFKISLDKRIAGAEAVGAHKTSMLQDVEHGRALELQALVGSVVELAQITQTPAPNIEAVHAVASLLAQTLAQHAGKLAISPA